MGLSTWVKRSVTRKILFSFSSPKTPTQVRNELSINKFSLKPFLKRKLVQCLTPKRRKGRLYVLTEKARSLLKISISLPTYYKDYALIGWIWASPKQRYVVLKTLSRNSVQQTSEEIRIKSASLNHCLSRISTKAILRELIEKELVDTELGADRRRYYWITEEGKSLASNLH